MSSNCPIFPFRDHFYVSPFWEAWRPAPDGESCTLHEVDSGEPLVDGLAYDGSCEDDQVLEDLGGGLYRITLNLPHARTPIRLHAVDRLQAVSAAENAE